MEQFLVDDLVMRLMAKRRECLHRIYAEYKQRIDAVAQGDYVMDRTYSEYVEGVRSREEKRREEARQQADKQKEGPRKRRAPPGQGQSKRRTSMVIHIGDMSFCFGSKEPEQVGGAQNVDPEVRNVLAQMNELFKKLNK